MSTSKIVDTAKKVWDSSPVKIVRGATSVASCNDPKS